MRIARIMGVVIALVALLGGVKGFAGTQPIVASDLLKIRDVTSIDVSRDGSRAVYAVRSIAETPSEKADDASHRHNAASAASQPTSQPAQTSGKRDDDKPRPEWKYQSHLFLLDLASPDAAPRQLTFGERFDSSPKLSPDGRRIAFVRAPPRSRAGRQPSAHGERDRGESAQIWILPVDGGEAWQLTDLPDGADSPQWSPDGLRVLAGAELSFEDLQKTESPHQTPPVPQWPSERPRREWNDATLPAGTPPSPDGTRDQIRAWLEDNASHADPVVIHREDFQEELSLREKMSFRHVFVFDVPASSGGKPISLDNARRVTGGFYDHTDAAFTADGMGVLYAAKKPTDQHPDRVLATDLWQVNIDGSNDRRILALDGWTLSGPKPSRDGAVIAFLGSKIDEPAFRQTQLGMASIKGETVSDPVWMTEETSFAASIDEFEWLALSPGIVFTAAMRGGFPLMTVSPGILQPATMIGEEDGLPVGVGAFAAGGGAVVCSVTSASNPCVVKVRDGRGVRMAHDLNEWVHDKNISLPVRTEIARPDGTKIESWLMEPINRDAGRKYPLCLQIHGGPSAMWGPGEFTMWHEFQMLCSRGYGVVYCNPRGSGGYGYTFQRGNYQDWGDGPAGDVLAAVDHALMKEWADAERLVVTGGSYAGYLTAWIIAHDHRFKAAVAQRGVYDLTTFFGEGNAWRLVQFAFGGNPYESRVKDIIQRNSPFTHVAKVRTPLLIMHSSNDLRTGVSQSEMLYRALKELKKDVEYVRYPNSGHDLSRSGDPRQRMDRLNRIIEFFERYIDNPRAMPTAR